MQVRRLDGRTLLRERHHQAILASARDLASKQSPDGLTVDEVAAAAGVSRRTVFNHFASFDALLVAVCDQILEEVVEQVLGHLDRRLSGASGAIAALDCLCASLRDADLPQVMAEIVGALSSSAQDDLRRNAISQTALDKVGGQLTAKVLEHVPDLDRLTLRLTIEFLMKGTSLMAHEWVETHGGQVTAVSRQDWDATMDRLVVAIQHGYRAE
ncbi:TetR/AcrR family transcriptional regulator [Kineosporia babensis]|uniref:TetR/AcrR family transcriptional regulator n=1 Tax=Kineosporia babensis TaxID=499548 RepID=A0A9X1NBI1_9ACTN|nr:TetR/AcrR family transcriptional regulator [Kineosporia babensis]MCD5311060.1 TetR/AcrR family transcriptional regulator [Kineosporia babensis]